MFDEAVRVAAVRPPELAEPRRLRRVAAARQHRLDTARAALVRVLDEDHVHLVDLEPLVGVDGAVLLQTVEVVFGGGEDAGGGGRGRRDAAALRAQCAADVGVRRRRPTEARRAELRGRVGREAGTARSLARLKGTADSYWTQGKGMEGGTARSLARLKQGKGREGGTAHSLARLKGTGQLLDTGEGQGRWHCALACASETGQGQGRWHCALACASERDRAVTGHRGRAGKVALRARLRV